MSAESVHSDESKHRCYAHDQQLPDLNGVVSMFPRDHCCTNQRCDHREHNPCESDRGSFELIDYGTRKLKSIVHLSNPC